MNSNVSGYPYTPNSVKTVTAPCEPQRMGVVREQLSVLGNNVEELRISVARLVDRVSPVLRSGVAANSAGDSKEAPAVNVPIGEEIASIRRAIQSISETVDDATSRVEV